jgi:hypothetical protein
MTLKAVCEVCLTQLSKRVDSGARIFAGHQLKAKSIQNLLIFPDFIFNYSKAFVLA